MSTISEARQYLQRPPLASAEKRQKAGEASEAGPAPWKAPDSVSFAPSSMYGGDAFQDSRIVTEADDRRGILGRIVYQAADGGVRPCTDSDLALLYSSSRDGFEALSFHELCDN